MSTKEDPYKKIKQEVENEQARHMNDFNLFSEKYWPTTNQPLEPQSFLNTVISGHLYVESIVNNILAEIFRNSTKFDKFTFTQKIAVLDATGLFPDVCISKLKALNVIRNNFAHNLDYKPSLKDIRKLDNSVKAIDWKKYPNAAMRAAIAYLCGYLHAEQVIIRKLKENKLIIL